MMKAVYTTKTYLHWLCRQSDETHVKITMQNATNDHARNRNQDSGCGHLTLTIRALILLAFSPNLMWIEFASTVSSSDSLGPLDESTKAVSLRPYIWELGSVIERITAGLRDIRIQCLSPWTTFWGPSVCSLCVRTQQWRDNKVVSGTLGFQTRCRPFHLPHLLPHIHRRHRPPVRERIHRSVWLSNSRP